MNRQAQIIRNLIQIHLDIENDFNRVNEKNDLLEALNYFNALCLLEAQNKESITK